MAESVRAFIAIELPDTVRRTLAEAQDALRGTSAGPSVRWVATDSIHLTLKFLGNVPSEKVDAVAAAIRRATSNAAPFSLTTGELGVFPPRGAPRVVWIGLRGELELLTRLQASMEREVAPLGFPTEARPFSPHLTLGRVRDGAAAEALRSLSASIAAAVTPSEAAILVDSVTLMRSQLNRSGSIYTPLTNVMLHRN